MKTYKLNYEDADIMNAIFNKASAPNHWRMNARLLKEHMEHFGPKAEQLDIFGEDGRATFTSFTEKLMDGIGRYIRPSLGGKFLIPSRNTETTFTHCRFYGYC